MFNFNVFTKETKKSDIVDINEVTKNADSFILADIFAIFLSVIFNSKYFFFFFCISL